MTLLGVVAHAEKTVGGGLEELRAALADAGHADPRTTLSYIRNRDRLSKSPAYVLRY